MAPTTTTPTTTPDFELTAEQVDALVAALVKISGAMAKISEQVSEAIAIVGETVGRSE